MLVARASPARLLELYYWSREPGMTELVRRLVTMPDESRATLEAFLALAGDPKSIEASLRADGTLMLSAPETPKAIAVATFLAENESSEESARTFN